MNTLKMELEYKWVETDNSKYVIKTPFDLFEVKRVGFRYVLLDTFGGEIKRFIFKWRVNEYIASKFIGKLEHIAMNNISLHDKEKL